MYARFHVIPDLSGGQEAKDYSTYTLADIVGVKCPTQETYLIVLTSLGEEYYVFCSSVEERDTFNEDLCDSIAIGGPIELECYFVQGYDEEYHDEYALSIAASEESPKAFTPYIPLKKYE